MTVENSISRLINKVCVLYLVQLRKKSLSMQTVMAKVSKLFQLTFILATIALPASRGEKIRPESGGNLA